MTPPIRQVISGFLTLLFINIAALIYFPQPVIAFPAMEIEHSLPKSVIKTFSDRANLGQVLNVIAIQHQFPLQTLEISLDDAWTTLSQTLVKSNLSPVLDRVIHNHQLMKDADRFLRESPEHLCSAYRDYLQDENNSTWVMLEAGAQSAMTLTSAVSAASAAGAGSLAGYAGIASAVSNLGLGGVVTLIANGLGSSVTGAAATAVVTSSVGGPVAMAALLIGGSGVLALGTYEAGHLTFQKLGEWADLYCNTSP